MRARLFIAWLGLLAAAAPDAKAEAPCVLEAAKLRYEDNHRCSRVVSHGDAQPTTMRLIPLDRAGQAVLRLGGEARLRYEYAKDPLFGAGAQDDTGVWLQRFMAHGDLRLGPNLRLFGQLSSAFETGRAGGPSPVDENQLELQNAFIDLNLPLTTNAALTIRGGRQELRFGSGRLVDVREGPNVRRTFDSVRAIITVPGWRVDALAARPRLSRPGVFDDRADGDQALWGVYAVGEGGLPAGAIDLYYLGYADKSGAFAQGTARERRHSIGARLHGAKRGWDWNWEAIYQFGSFGEGDISAWTIATETGVTLEERPWRPRLALSANIASGDRDPRDADLGTFNPLYPRGNYFSQAAVLGPRNFFNIHPFVTLHPSESWSLTADANVFWRLNKADGVYGPAGQLIREPSGSDARFVGSALSFTSEHALAERLTLAAIYTRFVAGDFIRATGPSDAIDVFDLTLQFRF